MLLIPKIGGKLIIINRKEHFYVSALSKADAKTIVFVWSQLDGGKVEQKILHLSGIISPFYILKLF